MSSRRAKRRRAARRRGTRAVGHDERQRSERGRARVRRASRLAIESKRLSTGRLTLQVAGFVLFCAVVTGMFLGPTCAVLAALLALGLSLAALSENGGELHETSVPRDGVELTREPRALDTTKMKVFISFSDSNDLSRNIRDRLAESLSSQRYEVLYYSDFEWQEAWLPTGLTSTTRKVGWTDAVAQVDAVVIVGGADDGENVAAEYGLARQSKRPLLFIGAPEVSFRRWSERLSGKAETAMFARQWSQPKSDQPVDIPSRHRPSIESPGAARRRPSGDLSSGLHAGLAQPGWYLRTWRLRSVTESDVQWVVKRVESTLERLRRNFLSRR